jgi:hypothetical protein
LIVSFAAGCTDVDAVKEQRASAGGRLDDAQIVGVIAELNLANQHGANIVLPILTTPTAVDLANTFLAQDPLSLAALLNGTKELPAGSDIVDQIIKQQILVFDVVTAQQGIAVDIAYYCALLRGQAQALDIYDGVLAPDVTRPAVADALAGARQIVLAYQQATLQAASPFGLTADNPICNPPGGP